MNPVHYSHAEASAPPPSEEPPYDPNVDTPLYPPNTTPINAAHPNRQDPSQPQQHYADLEKQQPPPLQQTTNYQQPQPQASSGYVPPPPQTTMGGGNVPPPPQYIQQPHTVYIVQPTPLIPDYTVDESVGASSAFSMAVCTSILFSCFGCFLLSCVPYWFVHTAYKHSNSEEARRISSLSGVLFWIFVMLNTCLCCLSILIIVIVPPSVVVQ